MINSIKVGMFAMVSMTDAQGSFSYNGVVTKVSIKTGQVAVDCTKYSNDITTVVVDVEDITILENEPTLVNRTTKTIVEKEVVSKPAKDSTPKVKKEKGPSETLQKVIDIVKNNPDLKRKQYIEMICKDMQGKTEAFASTYLHNAKAYL